MKPMFVAKASWFSVVCGLVFSACAPQVGSDRWFKETPADQIRMHYAYICNCTGLRKVQLVIPNVSKKKSMIRNREMQSRKARNLRRLARFTPEVVNRALPWF